MEVEMPQSIIERLEAVEAQIKQVIEMTTELREVIGVGGPANLEPIQGANAETAEQIQDSPLHEGMAPVDVIEPSKADQQEGEYDARHEAGRQTAQPPEQQRTGGLMARPFKERN